METSERHFTKDEIISIVREEIRMFREMKIDTDEDVVSNPSEKKITRKEYDRIVYFTQSVYVIFALIWIMLCVMNKFYDSIAAYVLFLPFIIFMLGFFNAYDTCHADVETDVFAVTFVSIGILISMPLLTMISKDGLQNKRLNHVIFLGMISILLSYFHLWVNYHSRHVCKAIRSCLETFSITLYIYAITIFFVSD